MSDHVSGNSDAHGVALPKFASSPAAMAGFAVIGVIGLVVCFLTAGSADRAWGSYLLGMLYWFTLALGSMFLLLTFHASAAKWVTGFRRIMEVCSQGVWIQSLFALVFLLFGMNHVYEWAKPGFVMGERGTFVGFRNFWLSHARFFWFGILYLVAFSLAVWFLNSWSRNQDSSGEFKWFRKLVRLGSGGVPVLGLVGTSLGFDWFMSLDPYWGSTIYGAYVLAGGYLAALAFTSLLGHRERTGKLRDVVGDFEYHNLGKLLFAMVCFWAYLGYAQYMLMWIANMPEEIVWWLRRFEGEWRVVFWILIFGHFVVPFFALLRKVFKLQSGWMIIVAAYIMLMHLIDVAFLVLPSESIKGHIQLSDLAAVVGIGGIHLAFVLWRFNGVVVAPRGDPNFAAPVIAH